MSKSVGKGPATTQVVIKGKGPAKVATPSTSTSLSVVPNDFDSNMEMLATQAIACIEPMSSGGRTGAKRRKQDPKTGKGLRHFSMKVCEKVKLKGATTYNEVADELVAEFSVDPTASKTAFAANETEPFDQKNIRRRVYDALNVLMAMNIISKEKKEIRWIGLPTNAAQECAELEQEKIERMERIKTKRQNLRDVMLHQICLKNLVMKNQRDQMDRQQENPLVSSSIINLPFIVVNTDKKTVIDCSISNDKTEYLFNFDSTFEIHDDIEILKGMGLCHHLEKEDCVNPISEEDANSMRDMLPEGLRSEFDEMLREREENARKGFIPNGKGQPNKSYTRQ